MDLRIEIDELISAGAVSMAALRLAKLWRTQSGLASAAFIVSRYEKLRDKLPCIRYRLAILRSFTLEPIIPLLRADAFCRGIDLSVYVGDFNAYSQEILDKESALYRFAPDAVVLAVHTGDVAPDLWRQYADLAQGSVGNAARRVCGSFQQWIRALREHSDAALIVHNFQQSSRPSLGVLDAQIKTSQFAAIQGINDELRRMARENRGVYVLDYDALVARQGRLRWQDERKWLTTRMPIAADQLVQLSREWIRFLLPLSGKVAKALVVDLDNTLWRGLIGEDGMTGIKLGPEYPGAAYQELQRALLDLSRRGILLAICSKNNLEDAMEVLNNHPGMLLRPKDFAAMRVNWNDKVQGLCEIASELKIGRDALAFLDDSAFEREQVRAFLPEVAIIELPADPLEYAATVRDCPAFERLALSAEDKQRTVFYAEEGERSKAEQSFRCKEDFYRFLEQETQVARAAPASLARIAQLTQKTNQFNLTMRRYGEHQIADMAARPGWQVLSIRVRDRFGDQGLVGVAITRDEAEVCEINTFLLSCRVIGRTVETAFLSYIAGGAVARGRRRLSGWFLPTKKNIPAREFYRQHGFRLEVHDGDSSLWILDLEQHQIRCPEWIKLTVANEGGNT